MQFAFVRIFILASIIISLLQAQTKNFIDQPYLETTALVDTLVTPDKITLDIDIREGDSKGKISLEEQEDKMFNTLISLGIDIDNDLSINDLSSNFKKYVLRSKDIDKSKSFSLIVHNADLAGKVLISLESIGISNVNIKKLEYKNLRALKLRLKSKAMETAYKQAKALTKPMGQSVGKVIHVTDIKTDRSDFSTVYSRSPGIVINQLQKKKMKALKAVSSGIQFEMLRFESWIKVCFALE
ncbi:MAG: SIMPL domain-containing protein [Bacteroidota bacterium]